MVDYKNYKAFFEKNIIESDRLYLRTILYSDLDDYNEIATQKNVGEMAGWKRHRNFSQSMDIINQMIEFGETIAVVEKENDKMIGFISLERFDECVENKLLDGYNLSFVLNRHYWNKGYMTEALESLLDIIFNIDSMSYIFAQHLLNNARSERLLKSLKFKYIDERISHVDGIKSRIKFYIYENKGL